MKFFKHSQDKPETQNERIKIIRDVVIFTNKQSRYILNLKDISSLRIYERYDGSYLDFYEFYLNNSSEFFIRFTADDFNFNEIDKLTEAIVNFQNNKYL